MKILIIVNSRITGVEYHRLIIPYQHLCRNYPDVKVFQLPDVSGVSIEAIKQFDVIVFSRLISASFNSQEIVKLLRKVGIKIVIDIDDYWKLPPSHLLTTQYKDHKITEQTIEGLRLVDLVTTTTDFFASEIRKINKNVEVLPNSVDPNEEQFKIKPQEHDRIKFGWIGGVHHREDIRLLYNSIGQIHSDNSIRGKYKLILGGYTDNIIYNEFVSIFSDNNKADYQSFSPVRSTDVFNYASMYNHLHVALAPLKTNMYNNCKSQLKAIEAAFMKKAVIVSNTMPYNIDCNKSNAILIDENSRSGWYKAIKRLINNPNQINDLACKLHQDITSKYDLNLINKKRYEILANLLLN